MHQNDLEGLLNPLVTGRHPSRVSDALGLTWDLRIRLPDSFPGDAEAGSSGTKTTAPLITLKHGHNSTAAGKFLQIVFELSVQTTFG